MKIRFDVMKLVLTFSHDTDGLVIDGVEPDTCILCHRLVYQRRVEVWEELRHVIRCCHLRGERRIDEDGAFEGVGDAQEAFLRAYRVLCGVSD